MIDKALDLKNLRRCILLCALLALLTFLPFMLQDGGVFLVASDFNDQQIPFTICLHNNLADGGFGGWSWNIDLGSPTLTSFTFYELGSVFFWLSMLFPARLFPWLVGWLYMLKYAAAGATAFLYLSLFVKDRRYAVAGAVLYAFSGFSAADVVYYHFHEVIAAFPLLLYGLERCIDDRRDAWMLVLATALCALTNYFFFVMECLFLVLYFLFRFWTWDLRKLAGRLLLCLGCGLLGAGIGAVLLLPSLLHLLSLPRSGADLINIDGLVYETRDFLNIVKGIFLPSEAMDDPNSIYRGHWLSTYCYLPLVGMSFVITYLHDRRTWLSRLMWAMLIISFSPLLTCGFLLFRGTYQRWWFMQLPSLPGGKAWTLPLLQNVLYFYSKQLGARTINAMSGQTYETVHAMLVRLDSEIQSFPDAVAAEDDDNYGRRNPIVWENDRLVFNLFEPRITPDEFN